MQRRASLPMASCAAGAEHNVSPWELGVDCGESRRGPLPERLSWRGPNRRVAFTCFGAAKTSVERQKCARQKMVARFLTKMRELAILWLQKTG